MELKKIEQFKNLWREQKGFISLELMDHEIWLFITRARNLDMAVDWAADYLLSQGLAEVQE